jgi:t-SNARE complex subunit (syntaxin)
MDRILEEEMRIENIAKRRQEDIENIVESFNKLAQQFKRLQIEVITQGTILDRIDYNLEVAQKNTDLGKKQLYEVKMENYCKNFLET